MSAGREERRKAVEKLYRIRLTWREKEKKKQKLYRQKEKEEGKVKLYDSCYFWLLSTRLSAEVALDKSITK